MPQLQQHMDADFVFDSKRYGHRRVVEGCRDVLCTMMPHNGASNHSLRVQWELLSSVDPEHVV